MKDVTNLIKSTGPKNARSCILARNKANVFLLKIAKDKSVFNNYLNMWCEYLLCLRIDLFHQRICGVP